MEIIYEDYLKYSNYISRYDLRYWYLENSKSLKVSSFEFESEIEIEKIVQCLREEKITHLIISTYGNCYRVDLTNLKYMPFIESLALDSAGYINTKTLESLPLLKSLWLNENFGEVINLEPLKNLRKLILYSCNNVTGIETICGLHTLKLGKYKEKNLLKLSNLTELEALEFVQPKCESFLGIEKLTKLKCLTVFYASKLLSIDNIKFLTNLEYLDFSNCKKIESFEALNYLVNIINVGISQSADLENVKWIEKMPQLQKATILMTNVIDGDISLLVKVPMHSYTNKKHFNYYENRAGQDIKR